jgi:hypothetical protein
MSYKNNDTTTVSWRGKTENSCVVVKSRERQNIAMGEKIAISNSPPHTSNNYSTNN